MSLNNVLAFALLLKKITRKSSIGRKSFQRMRKSSTATTTVTTTTVTATMSMKRDDDTQLSSVSSCSSSELEEVVEYEDPKRSSIIVSTASIKSLQPSQVKIVLKTPALVDNCNEKELNIEEIDDDTQTSTNQEVQVRDFAYPVDSPLHYGKSDITKLENNSSISLSSPEFNGRDARALFDFSPETEYEIALKAGQLVWVQYRQCPGWLIADVQDETGLIPESYVEFI